MTLTYGDFGSVDTRINKIESVKIKSVPKKKIPKVFNASVSLNIAKWLPTLSKKTIIVINNPLSSAVAMTNAGISLKDLKVLHLINTLY